MGEVLQMHNRATRRLQGRRITASPEEQTAIIETYVGSLCRLPLKTRLKFCWAILTAQLSDRLRAAWAILKGRR